MTALRARASRQLHKMALWICLGIFLIAAGTVWSVSLPKQAEMTDLKPTETMTKPTVPYPVSAQSNAAFFGNAYWGRSINTWSQASSLKNAYPFSRLNEFGWDKFDATVAGLECPTVAGLHLTPAQEEATLMFNCNPDYLSEAKKWFTAFMLANNHTDNQGAKGFIETQKHLDENGIQYFGHYDPEAHNDICDIIAIPAKVSFNDGSKTEGKLPVAMCGYHGVFKIPTATSYAVMQQYKEYMPVIAMTHMGSEYKATADPIRTASYHAMIDNGADMVLGDHPHWVQPTEVYKGRFIIYSMGNFMFDQQSNREVTRSAGVQVLFEAKTTDKTELKKWLDIGEACSAYHDDCLTRIKNAGLKKLPYTYKIGIIGVDTSGRITHPADPTVMQGIMDRLNWDTTKSQLQAPYAPL